MHKKTIYWIIGIVAIIIIAIIVCGFILGKVMCVRCGGTSPLIIEPREIARLECQKDLTNYYTAFSKTIMDKESPWYEKLCAVRYDVDLNGNRVTGLDKNGNPRDIKDGYNCIEYVNMTAVCPTG